MAGKDLKTLSKSAWTTESVTNNDLQTSCLMRIADASEAMARNFVQMQNDLKWANDANQRYRAENQRIGRTNSALRGQITRLRRQLATKQNND